MELAQLEAFLEGARRGSFRRAAQALFLTQPSLSARIRTLEQELGQPLFHRLGRGVRLTEAGRALLPFVERVMETLQQGKESLQALNSVSAGNLHVGSARAIGTYVLPGILEQFRQRYPGIEVSIRTGRSSEVLQMVAAQEVQVGLARELLHPEVETVHLYDEEIVLTVHPSHPFAQRGEVSIYDVAKAPLILYDRESSYFILIDQVCREAAIVPNVLMNLDSIEATKRMVERNLGVSFLPLSAIRRELELGMLVRAHLSGGHRVTLPTAVMVHKARFFSPPVLAFLKVLQDLNGSPALNALAGLEERPSRQPQPSVIGR
ncbi:MAG: LysR family transcriptional regulator [Chloroflexi bacterium]|nr:LysR family transcriptional regulator [Chloroflexota bacterium]